MAAGAESSLVAADVFATADRAAMKLGAASANANTNIPPWCNLRMFLSPRLSQTFCNLGSRALLSSCGRPRPSQRYSAVLDGVEGCTWPGVRAVDRGHGSCTALARGGRRQRGDSVGESCRGRRIHRQRALSGVDF